MAEREIVRVLSKRVAMPWNRSRRTRPEDYASPKNDAGFSRTSAKVVTALSELSASEAAQAAIAMPVVGGAPTTVADGIAQADGGQIVVTYAEAAAGVPVAALEWGACVASVGMPREQAPARCARITPRVSDVAGLPGSVQRPA